MEWKEAQWMMGANMRSSGKGGIGALYILVNNFNLIFSAMDFKCLKGLEVGDYMRRIISFKDIHAECMVKEQEG